VIDNPSPKIAVADIDRLEELIDQAPAHRDTVVSKRQAIGRLAPKLYAMRAKGYSWNAVAAWLTEHGLAVTAPLLNGYLRHVPSGSARGGTRTPRSSPQSLPVATVRAPPGAAKGGRSNAVAEPAEPHGAAAPPVVKDIAVRRTEQPVRRSEFAVRPDSEEI
jgi:hypothetical protein